MDYEKECERLTLLVLALEHRWLSLKYHIEDEIKAENAKSKPTGYTGSFAKYRALRGIQSKMKKLEKKEFI